MPPNGVAMGYEIISDEIIILRVSDWQQADKYVLAFGREQGKIRFIAYGARYPKNMAGRLLQPFAHLRAEVRLGQRVDKLLGCDLVKSSDITDMKQMAYASVMTELAALLTEDHESVPELYRLLSDCLSALLERNPRLVMLTFAVQLLGLTGLAPQMRSCVICSGPLGEDVRFSSLHGGAVCSACHSVGGETMNMCGEETRDLWLRLEQLNFSDPEKFVVRGGTLMELEKLLYHFIMFQTDKPLNSLSFIRELGI